MAEKVSASLILGLMITVLSWDIPAAEETAEPRSQTRSPRIWPSQPPEGCPFGQSEDIVGVAFAGLHSDYHVADTWYPSWASDGNLYSPWTDGQLEGVGSSSGGKDATTGQAIMIGDDPLTLELKNLGLVKGDPAPYQGRYPCGSLVYNGVWYYGTYCLGPAGRVEHEGVVWNWPVLGPTPGFRVSTDYGKTWIDTPHTPAKPLFPEPAEFMGPVKIGAPHFVDFGKNMEHSLDGKAYLVGHGAEASDPQSRYANLSWISADQVYLIRVTPSPENINDFSKYEFFGGRDEKGDPIWTRDFSRIMPLIDWNNNCGCATMTYNAHLKKYLMCVTDGWPTCAKMSSYILESDRITGPWKLVSYMKDFGEQGYFLNIPSKFIAKDGRTAWLCYSANFATNWRKGVEIRQNPSGSHYGLVLQEIRLLDKKMYLEIKGKFPR